MKSTWAANLIINYLPTHFVVPSLDNVSLWMTTRTGSSTGSHTIATYESPWSRTLLRRIAHVEEGSLSPLTSTTGTRKFLMVAVTMLRTDWLRIFLATFLVYWGGHVAKLLLITWGLSTFWAASNCAASRLMRSRKFADISECVARCHREQKNVLCSKEIVVAAQIKYCI